MIISFKCKERKEETILTKNNMPIFECMAGFVWKTRHQKDKWNELLVLRVPEAKDGDKLTNSFLEWCFQIDKSGAVVQ